MHWKLFALTPLVTLSAIAVAQEVPEPEPPKNTAPVVDSVTVSPAQARTDTELACAAKASDADGDEVTLGYAWLVNGSASGATGEALVGRYFGKDDKVSCQVTPSDGKDKGEAVTSAAVLILNTLPELGAVAVAPAKAHTGTALSCNATGAKDADGDPVQLKYLWKADGVAIAGTNAKTLAADKHKRGQKITCAVTPNDGGADGQMVESEAVTIANTAPTFASVTTTPDELLTTSAVKCQPGEAADVDGDSVSFTYTWLVAGKTVDGQTTDTLPASATAKGQSVVCQATPTDGTDAGTPRKSAARTVKNTGPSLASVSIDNTSPATTDALVCQPGKATDDDQDTVSFSYRWLDGERVLSTSQTLTAGLTKKGQSLLCEATPRDPSGARGEPVKSAAVTVKNTVPTLAKVSVSPSAPTTDKELSCTPSGGADADRDAITYSYAWTVGGSAVAGVTENKLPAAKFAKNQDIVCTVTPSDDEGAGAAVSSEPARSVNTKPVLADVAISPDKPVTTDTFTCTPGESTDADGDAVSYTYRWLANGSAIDGQTSKTLPSSAFKKGQGISCEATPTDGEASGAAKRSATRSVANTPPTLASAKLDKTVALTTDTLECQPAQGSDADGDTVSFLYAWYVNEAKAGSTAQKLTSGYFKKGDKVVCEATPRDTAGARGDAVKTAAATIDNSAPKLSSATLSSKAPATDQALSCRPGSKSDADGDPVELKYSWSVDGATVAGVDGAELPASHFKKNQKIACTVTPNDGTANGQAITSEPAVAKNTLPKLADVQLTPDKPVTTSTMSCKPGAATDGDDDAVNFAYQWLVSGRAVDGQSGPTLASTHFKKGQSVQCVVTPNDGEGDGSAVRSATRVPANTPPTLASAAVDNKTPKTTDTLECEPGAATDDDDDRVSFRYAWYVDDAKVASSSQSLSSSYFSKGQAVSCEATPTDGSSSGDAVKSAAVTVVNSPPKVSGATVSPSSPKTTDELSCRAGAGSDPDRDEVSFDYKWTVDGAVAGGNSDKLAASAFKKNNKVVCTVTPKDGTATGEPVASAEVVVQNTTPVLSEATTTPSEPSTSDSLLCKAGAATDADGDSVSFDYKWTVSGRLVGDNSNKLASDAFGKNQSVVCTVTPKDDQGSGRAVAAAAVRVKNTAPSLASAAIEPKAPFTNQSVTCVPGQATDDDNDRVYYGYAWTVDGAAVSSSSVTLSSSFFKRDQKVVCEATPKDGTNDGAPVKSAAIVVQNTAPKLSSASLGPSTAYTDTELECKPGRSSDLDGDEVSFTYAWEVNGSSVAGSGAKLSGSSFKKGDQVQCKATPTDGTDSGEAVASNAITIVNSAPQINSVVLTPDNVFTEGTIKVSARASDADGDEVKVTYQWLVNGRVVPDQTERTLDGKQFFDRDDKVVARVSVNDGFVDGKTQDSEPLSVKNTPPTNVNVFIADPEGGFVDLKCLVVGESTDLDGDTVSYRFEFFENDTPYTGPTNTARRPGDSVPASELDVDEHWRCKATPTDGTDDGPSADWTTTVIPGIAGGGSSHGCALSTLGQLSCWGLDDYKVASPPDETTYRRLAVGGWHNCALTAKDGQLACWGHRTYGQDRPPKGQWNEVASGWWHSCAINSAGEVACWGQSADGRTEVPKGKKFIALDAGGQHTCALEEGGAAVCWGHDEFGQSTPPPGTFVEIATGEYHSCARKADGTVVCWGNNESAQLDVPNAKFTKLGIGARHTCGVTTSKQVKCWGLNNYDQLTPPADPFRVVGKGMGHTCGIDDRGSVRCWGKNNYQQATPPEFLVKQPAAATDEGGG